MSKPPLPKIPKAIQKKARAKCHKVGHSIFIPGNTPSSKNSKRWTGKILINSKTVMAYKKSTAIYYQKHAGEFRAMTDGLEMPYRVGLYFIRDTKRKWDYINIAQIVMDEMQRYHWIDNDCMSEVVPVFKGYEVDKDRAGVIITVEG